MSLNLKAKKVLNLLLLTGGILWVSSCQLFNAREEGDEKGQALARVYDRYLYKSDVAELMPENVSDEDSLAFLQNYINIWAKDQLMILKAEYNLTESQKNFEKQIEEYRNDLLKFAYRQEYISQALDTNINEQAIRESYKSGSNDFVLKENIVRADYVVLNLEAPKLDDAVKWFYSTRAKDREELYDYALKYAYKFSLNDSSWIGFDRLKKIIPVTASSQTDYIRNTNYDQFKDSTNIYLLRIRDYKLKGDKAPLPYSRSVIKNILINKRKLQLINKLEQNLLDDALEKKEFEVY